MATKAQILQEIEQLDDNYLELVYRLLQQFPHKISQAETLDVMQCSRPIDYAVPDIDDAPVLSQIEDAASYVKALRSAWRDH